jgi:peptide/nickel transport system substrate-binding protein
VSAGQIISKNLEDIGIRATVATLDVSAWFDAVQKGEYTMSIAFSGQGPTPFNYYRNMMSSTTLFPVGEPAQNNWHRFSLPEADELLTQMGQTADVEEQKAIVAQLQELFNQNAPMVPLHGAPQWGEFVTLRFEGFPSEENPYASLPTWDTPERLVVMTTITPIEGA